MMTVRKCPICLGEFEDMSEDGFENHKNICRERELESIKHRKETADILHDFKPLSFADIGETLETTIKQDKVTKLVTFAAMILTYTEQEQLNLLFAAESASGKSYTALELAAYFPPEDVVKLGGASPTAFFHEVSSGKLAEWDEENKTTRVKLANKILIFLDQPHDQLLQKMRAFLSHDEKEITYKIADRSQKAGLRTRTIIIEGFPTWIFCTAAFNLDQQERTRNLQLSPETGPDKVKQAQALLLERKTNRDAFRDKLQQDPKRRELRDRIAILKEAKIRDVIIPEPLRDAIGKLWDDNHHEKIPRHVRDLDRFLSLVKARALLNFAIRPQESDNRIVAIEDDMNEIVELYKEIAESNELGIAPQVYEIFKEVFAKFPNGADKRTILREYYAVFHRPLSTKRLEKEILTSLEASGLIEEEPDPEDKRRVLFIPHLRGYISSPETPLKLNTPGSGGKTPEQRANGEFENIGKDPRLLKAQRNL
jgi:hypothetical protein